MVDKKYLKKLKNYNESLYLEFKATNTGQCCSVSCSDFVVSICYFVFNLSLLEIEGSVDCCFFGEGGEGGN